MPKIRDSVAPTLRSLPPQGISTEVLIEKYAKEGATAFKEKRDPVFRGL